MLHLATHGVLDSERAFQSALILAQDQLPDPLERARRGLKPFDGRLTAQTIRDTWQLHADPALEAVKVRFDIRGVAAYVFPVAVGDPTKDVLAFLEQLREHVTGPVGDLACPEELEDRGVQDVDARVGQVGDDLAPARLFDEALDGSSLVDDHDAVLERVWHRLEDDGGDGFPLAMEARRRTEVDVGQRIAGDDDKGFVQLLASEHDRTGGAER